MIKVLTKNSSEMRNFNPVTGYAFDGGLLTASSAWLLSFSVIPSLPGSAEEMSPTVLTSTVNQKFTSPLGVSSGTSYVAYTGKLRNHIL